MQSKVKSGRRRRLGAEIAPASLATADLPELWAAAAQSADDAIIGIDRSGRVWAWNHAATSLFGYTRAQMAAVQARALFVEPVPGVVDPLELMLSGSADGRTRTRARRRNGTEVPVAVTTALVDGGGAVCISVRDLSELQAAETGRAEAVASVDRQIALWKLLQRMTTIANDADDLTEALQRCMLEICNRFEWPFGHAVLIDSSSGAESHIWYMADRDRFSPLRRVIETGEADFGLAGAVLDSRESVWIDQFPALPKSVAAVAEAAGVQGGFAFPVVHGGRLMAAMELLGSTHPTCDSQLVACARHGAVQLGRVVEREQSRVELSRQAMHDALTNLPNRSLFMDRLAQAVRGLRPGGPHLAVLFVDLDDFKLINDSLGHATGDHVLKTVARRFVDAAGPDDTVARFGGDEFIILSERLPNDEAVGDLASRLVEALAEPIPLGAESAAVVTGSVGIAIATTAGTLPEHLVRDADAAMYRAKEEGRGRFNIFDTVLHERARRKLSIGSELRQAIADQELSLVYQPQFRLSDGMLIGVEALARWHNPTRGTMAPSEWIPVAEENHLIVPIGEWILAEACQKGADWSPLADQQDAPFKVCVNVSAVQLARHELIDAVVAALHRTGLDPASLCVEVTESVLMAAPGTYLEALLGLKMLGLSIAVDDFGTGYSSLAYLRRFPIDVIKVDKGFVDGLARDDERGRAILRAVIQLSEALGVISVAEGVETVEQAELLAESGCFAAQGFYYGRPQSAAGITRLLRARS